MGNEYCALSHWPHFACDDQPAEVSVTFSLKVEGDEDIRESHRYCMEHAQFSVACALIQGCNVRAEPFEPAGSGDGE